MSEADLERVRKIRTGIRRFLLVCSMVLAVSGSLMIAGVIKGEPPLGYIVLGVAVMDLVFALFVLRDRKA